MVESLAAAGTVFLIICGAFNYVVISPLQAAIKSLQAAIDDMRAENKEREAQRQSVEIRVNVIEDNLSNCNRRVDKLETKLDRG